MSNPSDTIRTLLTMGSGVALSILPPAALAVSGNTLEPAQQGIVAVAVLTATFVGQVATGAIVEARLASPTTTRSVATPWWLSAVGLIGAVVLFLYPSSPLAIAVALPALFSALEVGRSVAISEALSARETSAGILLGAGAGLAVWQAIVGGLPGFSILAVASALAILVRAVGAPGSAPPPDRIVQRWVVSDVTFTGITFPVLNTVILAVLGPAAAAIFATVSTVSGLLSIPLNFLRVRLLKEHSRREIVTTALVVLVAMAAIGAAAALGLFSVLFGETWTWQATTVPLVIACLWRCATLVSAIPFAALRRDGHARIVTMVRVASALTTVVLSVVAALTQMLSLVFVALLVGELILAGVCEVARRRVSVENDRTAT